MKIEFILNDQPQSIDIHPTERLLDVLRDRFDLTGVKEGCGEGECGACVVLMNGKAVNSCLVPMGNVYGKAITSIEGFRKTKRFKVIEQAYMEAGSVQCGFCTPGFILSTESLLNENPNPNDEEIKAGLSGNLCRCTGYTMIIEAVKIAARKGAGLW